MRGWSKSSLLVVAAVWACSDLFGPRLPEGATPFTPPDSYTNWWAQVESCSAIVAPMSRVAWYWVPPLADLSDGSFYNPATGTSVRGLWVSPHSIYLGESYSRWSPIFGEYIWTDGTWLDSMNVRHEMLHDLLQAPGHPAEFFKVKCGSLVDTLDI